MVFYHIFNVLPSFPLLLAEQNLVVRIESKKIIAKRGMVLDEHTHTPGKAKLDLPCLQDHLLFNQILDAYQDYLVEYEQIVLHMFIHFHNLREELLCKEPQNANLGHLKQFRIALHTYKQCIEAFKELYLDQKHLPEVIIHLDLFQP